MIDGRAVDCVPGWAQITVAGASFHPARLVEIGIVRLQGLDRGAREPLMHSRSPRTPRTLCLGIRCV